MPQSNEGPIQEKLALMNDNEKRLYAEAKEQGYKDAVCGKCSAVFLAFHSFIRCNEEYCPMIARKVDGSPAPSLLELISEDPAPPK